MNSRAHSTRLEDAHYAVIDFETTGLFPRRGDRVIEVGVVLVGYDGSVEGEYQTLVSPQRDIGHTRIHGIRAKDVIDAPSFADIAGDLIAQFEHRVVVAHNARFDLGFLERELARLELAVPPLNSICTLKLSRRLMPGTCPRRLGDLCLACGIQAQNAHSAADDARATASLLTHLLRVARETGFTTLGDLGCELAPTAVGSWPAVRRGGATKPRTRIEQREGPSSPLAAVIARLPSVGEPSGVPREYLELLDRVLEDREVLPSEAAALDEVAQQFGLTRDEVFSVHFDYLRRALTVARRDNLVDAIEHAELVELTELLGLPPEVLCEALALPVDSEALIGPPQSGTHVALVGLRVCFTGQSRAEQHGVLISRSEAERLAAAAGLVPVRTVTKSLDILVLADPASQSTKARQARKYGVRLIAEAEFWRMLGADVR